MSTIRPWSANGHAIVQAAFAITFTARPAESTVRELIGLHSKLKEDFPRKRETLRGEIAISADFDAQQLHQASRLSSLGGFAFDSLAPDGKVIRSVTLSDTELSVVRTDYEKWDKTWSEVRKTFNLMLPILLQRSDVSAIHLQYHDRFVWEGDHSKFHADMVLRRESHFVVPNIFDARDLWHSYHGYFEYLKQPQMHQLLNVIEVQTVPSESVGLTPDQGLVVEVRLNHRATPGQDRAGARGTPLTTVQEVLGEGDSTGLLDDYINEMHERDKWLLSRLINDEMCDKIGLERPK